MRTVGQRIEYIAAQKGLPANSALAKLLGVSYETLRKWRSGTTAPSRTRICHVAQVLGVGEQALRFGTDASAAEAGAPRLTSQEQRLLAAFRVLLTEERETTLLQVEKQAAGVKELLARLRAERTRTKGTQGE